MAATPLFRRFTRPFDKRGMTSDVASTRRTHNAIVDMFAGLQPRTIADRTGFGHIANIECLADRMLREQEKSSFSGREICRWQAIFAVVGGTDPVMDMMSSYEFLVPRSVRAGVFDNPGAGLSWVGAIEAMRAYTKQIRAKSGYLCKHAAAVGLVAGCVAALPVSSGLAATAIAFLDLSLDAVGHETTQVGLRAVQSAILRHPGSPSGATDRLRRSQSPARICLDSGRD